MSRNKDVVREWGGFFSRQDWTGMLTLMTEDIERWEVGAPTRSKGKKEFAEAIAPGPEVQRMTNAIHRMVEEDDVVVAQGRVEVFKRDGSVLQIEYCDLFEFRDAKIKRITAFANVV